MKTFASFLLVCLFSLILARDIPAERWKNDMTGERALMQLSDNQEQSARTSRKRTCLAWYRRKCAKRSVLLKKLQQPSVVSEQFDDTTK
ncbi:hypothetical protein AC249_AIPGENE28210 [Exaiptasia diaphana]|nr:hypothetical protein AC249_AIPGENE28210 [Exaiptasia diaphana]